MSTRKQVIDDFIEALEDINGVKLVTKDVDTWNSKSNKDYPCIFIHAKKVESEEWMFESDTLPDTKSTLEFTVEGVLQSRYGKDLEDKLDTLLKNIIQTFKGTRVDNVLRVDADGDEFIASTDEKFGMISTQINVEYVHNHLDT